MSDQETITELSNRIADLEIALSTALLDLETERAKRARIKITPEMDVAFDEFWECYPRKIGKGAARKAFHAQKCHERVAEMVRAVEDQKQKIEWTKDGGQFIPHPRTWIHQQRWLDEGTNTNRFTKTW